MTDTNYLYEYFLEKSQEDNNTDEIDNTTNIETNKNKPSDITTEKELETAKGTKGRQKKKERRTG